MLQLHKTEDGKQEYAEFLHQPRKRFSDFGNYVSDHHEHFFSNSVRFTLTNDELASDTPLVLYSLLLILLSV